MRGAPEPHTASRQGLFASRSQVAGTVRRVTDNVRAYAAKAAAAFARQLRNELRGWTPSLSPQELGRWAAEMAVSATPPPQLARRERAGVPGPSN